MSPAVLFPRFDHPAIEERYASWQSQMLLRRASGADLVFYDPEEPASYAVSDVDDQTVLVVTDPLLLPPAHLPARLRDVLAASDAVAALPVSNEAQNEKQRRGPLQAYLTLRELEAMTVELQRRPVEREKLKWDKSDPAAYVCRTDMLLSIDDVPRRALAGREVVVSGNDYVHRWASMRGQARQDLLDRIATDAKSILEFGCGEAPLGAALKQRQKCRVVGIEIDRHAAAIAKKRIDDVYCGDAREIIELLHEQFDWIIGGDIIEHLDDPWTFLSDLRRITKPGGRLLLSIPNLSHAALVADLLAGRFDYVYMGLACVGHLRFFTRHSIAEMLSIAGWSVEKIEPQAEVPSIGAESLLRALEESRLPFSRDDLLAPGYYVTARKV